MKAPLLQFNISFALVLLCLCSYTQIQIDTTQNPVELLEQLLGPGIEVFDNVQYQGANRAIGKFTNGIPTNLIMESGVFLCTGDGTNIPGPNNTGTTGSANYTGGHPSLDAITTGATYDAAVLSFDFIPIHDTIIFSYIFGSEEYNEFVGSIYNDVFGVFITGLNPYGGNYNNKNIAIVPGTTNTSITINNLNNGWSEVGQYSMGPCSHCEYFTDNVNGAYDLEYDGITTRLIAWLPVVANEVYHCKIGIADVNSLAKDSGVFLETNGFKSDKSAEFVSFNFLKEFNPSLIFDVIGQIYENTVYLEVPEGTDISNLIASYTYYGIHVTVNNVIQFSNFSANDFTFPIEYFIEGFVPKEYSVHVDIVSGIHGPVFENVCISPNPSKGQILISNSDNLSVSVINSFGTIIRKYKPEKNQIQISKLQPGFYFIKLDKDGKSEVRKVIVN